MAGEKIDKSPGFWRIVGETMVRAPARARLGIYASIALILVATALAITLGIGWQTTPSSLMRAGSLIFANIGLLMLMVAGLLYRATLRAKGKGLWACGVFFEEPKELHTLVMALPLFGFKAAVLLTMGMALLIPDLLAGDSDQYFAPAAVCLFFILVSAKLVRDTTKFLYRYGADQAHLAAQSQREATEAHLAALQAQMNPHFLFNALNTVAGLVRLRPAAAERTVENLAQVLRRTLDRNQKTTCTLEDEIEFVKAYLGVEGERFGDRLTVDWSIGPRVRSILVPPMTLQLLVENALKHGVGTTIEGGTIHITAIVEGTVLRLKVSDTGPGFSRRFVAGTGLSNLRNRLYTLYHGAAHLKIEDVAKGATVTVEIPILNPTLAPTDYAFTEKSDHRSVKAGS